jgi:hypothetical protein
MLNFKNKKRKFKDTEKGMAMIEAIPVLFMLVVVFNFSLGFFGAIHSGILNSIGSYNYALETFRFRSNLMYFRPGATGPGTTNDNYSTSKNRVHGVTKEGNELSATTPEEKSMWPATVRPITFNFVKDDPKRGLTSLTEVCDDNGCRSFDASTSTNIWNAKSEYEPEEGTVIQTPRIWVKTVYGICITADCGE